MKLIAPTFRAGIALAMAALLAAGCGKKAAPDVLAQVGGQVITVADFQAEIDWRIHNRQSLPERQALLEEMVDRLALVQRSRAAGLDQSAAVRRAVEGVLISKLQETIMEPQQAAVKVSPEEIRAAYDRELSRFTQPAKVRLAFVFLAADAKAGTNRLEEIRARAAEARQQALALPATEKGFGAVAADYSEDQISRYRGGDAGWLDAGSTLAGRWPETVIAAGFALQNIGDMSQVLPAADGFYLVRKMDARPSVVAPLASVQTALERRLLAEKRQAAAADFKRSTRAALVVSTDLSLLSRVAYPDRLGAPSGAPPSLPHSP